jgi:hypothetical protein
LFRAEQYFGKKFCGSFAASTLPVFSRLEVRSFMVLGHFHSSMVRADYFGSLNVRSKIDFAMHHKLETRADIIQSLM